jgi:hypothetical protein
LANFGNTNKCTHLVCAIATDEGHATGLLVRVNDAQQPDELIGVHGRSDLDPDRIPESSEELDVCAVEGTGAVADPYKVGRSAVEALLARASGGKSGNWQFAGQGRFVLEHERL